MSSPTTPPPTPTTPLTPCFTLPLSHRPHTGHALSRPRSPIRRHLSTSSFSTPLSTPITFSNIKSQRSPAFLAKLTQISTHLSLLVSLSTGTAHTLFPKSLLSFYLLTSDQLDELAAYYHQSTLSVYSRHYPCPVWESWDANASLADKRRRLGRFVGLRGCESPVLSERDFVVRSVAEIEAEVREERHRRGGQFMGAKGRWY